MRPQKMYRYLLNRLNDEVLDRRKILDFVAKAFLLLDLFQFKDIKVMRDDWGSGHINSMLFGYETPSQHAKPNLCQENFGFRLYKFVSNYVSDVTTEQLKSLEKWISEEPSLKFELLSSNLHVIDKHVRLKLAADYYPKMKVVVNLTTLVQTSRFLNIYKIPESGVLEVAFDLDSSCLSLLPNQSYYLIVSVCREDHTGNLQHLGIFTEHIRLIDPTEKGALYEGCTLSRYCK